MPKHKPKRPQYPIGTVSSGTMVETELIGTFLYELRHAHLSRANRNKVRAIEAEYNKQDKSIDGLDPDGNWDECLQDLFEIMDTLSGPFFYFGAHPGDGADYGYWLSEDWQQQLLDDGGVCVSDAEFDLTANTSLSGHHGYVAVINDHGNATLYWMRRGKLTEVWSVV